jgi:outer membrane lipoprotein-sorting protein
MSIFTAHPSLRWGVPAAAAAVVALAAVIPSGADASAPLPPRTAEQLLVDVQNARLDGLSGTVVQTANLGLPDLSGLVGAGHGGGTSGSSDLTSLVTGSHTLRVWYSGTDKQRIALLGSLGESDIIHNGSDLWVWSSQDNTATHYTVTPPPNGGDRPDPVPGVVPATPGEAASQALAAIDPSTRVSTDGSATIAGRAAYELVLTPRDRASLVAQVRIAVDAETRIPLRVQVFSTKISDPALEVGFTQVDFSVPEDRQFEFNAPPGTTVTEADLADADHAGPAQGTGQLPPPNAPAPGAHPEPTVVGEGWTSVMVATMPTASPQDPATADPATKPGVDDPAGPRELAQLQGIVDQLPEVSGSWGSGRLLEGTLFSAVITDDGRVAVGAVTPQRLYQALGAA